MAGQIRLWGIDCPEKGQDFGTKAKQSMSILVFAKTVEVEPVMTDRYGRTVAFVRVGDTLVNEELIRQGLAWVFTRYCDRPICQGWKVLARITHEPPTATADMALPSGCPRVSNFATY